MENISNDLLATSDTALKPREFTLNRSINMTGLSTKNILKLSSPPKSKDEF